MIPPKVADPIKQTPSAPTDAVETHTSGRSATESCAKIRDLGFTASKQIKIYGERFELVSDPFEDGECTAIQVVSENDRTIRTLRLPQAILIGLSDRFRKSEKSVENESSQRRRS
jgi:hypothetical protein